MERAEIHGKLQKVCAVGGHMLSETGEGWDVALDLDASRRVTVTPDAANGVVLFACRFAIPAPPDLSHLDPNAPETYRQMLLVAATARDVLLRADLPSGARELTLSQAVHEDGFTVQEALRTLAAMDRAENDVAAAADGFVRTMPRALEIDQALARSSSLIDELDQLGAAMDAELGYAPAAGVPTPAPAAVGPATGWAPAPPAPGQCAGCGTALAPDSRFCSGCGRPAYAAPLPGAQAPPAQRRCPNPVCGRVLAPDKRFCPGCGTPVQ